MLFIKFLGVGGFATVLQYVLLVVFVEWLTIKPFIAAIAAYALSSIVNYMLNYYLTFSSVISHKIASVKFAIVATVGVLLTAALMYILVDINGLYYLLAQIITTLIVLVFNFFLHRYWTYH